MNTAAKALYETTFLSQGLHFPVSIKRHLKGIVLLMTILATGLGVVYLKDYKRQLVSSLSSTQQQHDQLQIELGRLLLEQATLATQARVERIARATLEMQVPSLHNVVIVDTRQ